MRLDIDTSFGREQVKIMHEGTEYTLQNVPLKAFYEMQERNRDKFGNPISSKLYDEIFKNIIISPKVGFENYESIDEIEGLMAKVFLFLSRDKSFSQNIQGQTQA